MFAECSVLSEKKGKSNESIPCMRKIAASVVLKLYINGYDRFHTTSVLPGAADVEGETLDQHPGEGRHKQEMEQHGYRLARHLHTTHVPKALSWFFNGVYDISYSFDMFVKNMIYVHN